MSTDRKASDARKTLGVESPPQSPEQNTYQHLVCTGGSCESAPTVSSRTARSSSTTSPSNWGEHARRRRPSTRTLHSGSAGERATTVRTESTADGGPARYAAGWVVHPQPHPRPEGPRQRARLATPAGAAPRVVTEEVGPVYLHPASERSCSGVLAATVSSRHREAGQQRRSRVRVLRWVPLIHHQACRRRRPADQCRRSLPSILNVCARIVSSALGGGNRTIVGR